MAVINMSLPEMEETNGPVQLTDTAPYLYRQSPIITEKLSDKLIGGTYAFNQLANGANAVMAESFGTLTVTDRGVSVGVGTTNNNANVLYRYVLSVGHVYMAKLKAKSSGNAGVRFMYQAVADGTMSYFPSPSTTYSDMTFIVKIKASVSYFYLYWNTAGLLNVGDTVDFDNVMFFDLTQMFGPTIADYLYTLEQTTASAGVAWFRNLFPADYYEYNAGELISVKTSAHKTVEKNLFVRDGELNRRFLDANGQIQAMVEDGWILSDFIKVLPNTQYTFTPNSTAGAAAKHGFFTAGGVFISAINSGQITFITPSNCCLMRFSYRNTSADIQLELGSTATTYEPYEENVYPLDNDLELRGIPKLDANNNLYYDGDVYESSGSVTRKYGIVDLGTLSWDSGTYAYYASPTGMKAFTQNVVCANYVFVTNSPSGFTSNDQFTTNAGGGLAVWFAKGNYSTAAAFKTAMSGVMLVYELATPTTETAAPFTDPQDAGYTEQYIDDRAVPVPVGHETEYFDMEQDFVIPMSLPMYGDNDDVVIPMAIPHNASNE